MRFYAKFYQCNLTKVYVVNRVALLLALVMVISMLPMNVFGARGTITGIQDNTNVNNFTVNIDAFDFRNRHTTPVGLFIEFTVTDAAFPVHDINTTNEVGDLGVTEWEQTAGAASIPFRNWLNSGDITRWSGTRLTVELPDPPAGMHTENVLNGDLVGIFTRQVRIDPSNADARLTVRLMGVDANGNVTNLVTLAEANLVRSTEAGVTITAGTPVPLVGAARVNNIVIRENSPGTLAPASLGGAAPVAASVPIRLLAPLGFRWALGQDMSAVGGAAFTVASPNEVINTIDQEQVFENVPDINGRDAIIVHARVERNSSLLAQSAIGEIELRNLWLVATADAPRTGTANIEVAIGYFARSIEVNNALRWAHRTFAQATGEDFSIRYSAVGAGPNPAPHAALVGQLQWSWQANPRAADGIADGPENRNTGAWRNLNLPVGVLGTAGQITVEEFNDRPTLVSGSYQESWSGTAATPTGVIRMTETVPTTMFRGVETYTFRLLQDGVSFVDVRARARHVRREGIQPADTDTSDRHAWWGVDNNNPDIMANSLAGTRVGSDVITIMPRPQGEVGNNIYTGLRTFDVQFQLSVEAGFARNYDEILVEVSIFPHGVTEVVSIANVVDPIIVDSVTPIQIIRPTAAGFDHLAPTALPDITITESEYGKLEVGDRIWLYLVGVHEATGRIIDHPHWPTNFFTSGNPIIEGGLRLSSQGIVETVPDSGIFASVFIVTAPSTDDEPATITFTDNFIDGFVSSGNDYRVVIGGSSISRNSYANVAEDDRAGYEVGSLDMNPLFSGLTYDTTVLVVRTVGGEVDGPGVGPGLGINVIPLELRPGMGSIWTNVDNDPQLVEAPFRFVPNPVNANYTMGMLNPRVFAHWISGSTGFADGVVTLTGRHFDGHAVEVVMTVGQNYAFINGERHDIATFAARDGHGTGPTGSVTPMNVDGRVFVPIRFLTNAFGRFVTFDGDFPNVVVTLEG